MSGLIAAGRLNRTIRLQTATKTQDPITGEELLTWTEGERVPAEWLPGTTREAYQAGQRLGAYIDGVFRIRYRTPIPTPDATRIVQEEDDRVTVYDLKPTVEIGFHEGLELPVVARAE